MGALWWAEQKGVQKSCDYNRKQSDAHQCLGRDCQQRYTGIAGYIRTKSAASQCECEVKQTSGFVILVMRTQRASDHKRKDWRESSPSKEACLMIERHHLMIGRADTGVAGRGRFLQYVYAHTEVLRSKTDTDNSLETWVKSWRRTLLKQCPGAGMVIKCAQPH